MRLKQHFFYLACIIALSLSLTGCAFRQHKASNIPLPLHHIYLETKNPYSVFTTQFTSMLRSLNITLANTHHTAPYTIKISTYNFSKNTPAITTTTLIVTSTYTLSLNISILDKSGKMIIGPKSLRASQSTVQSASQVYTPGTATLAKQALRRDIISQIYYFLISENTRRALDKNSHVH